MARARGYHVPQEAESRTLLVIRFTSIEGIVGRDRRDHLKEVTVVSTESRPVRVNEAQIQRVIALYGNTGWAIERPLRGLENPQCVEWGGSRDIPPDLTTGRRSPEGTLRKVHRPPAVGGTVETAIARARPRGRACMRMAGGVPGVEWRRHGWLWAETCATSLGGGWGFILLRGGNAGGAPPPPVPPREPGCVQGGGGGCRPRRRTQRVRPLLSHSCSPRHTQTTGRRSTPPAGGAPSGSSLIGAPRHHHEATCFDPSPNLELGARLLSITNES